MFAVLILAATLATATPAPNPGPTLSPQGILRAIRAQFRSHRPPPPYVVYRIERFQKDTNGYTDFANSYKYKVWYRSSDHAALEREVAYYQPGILNPALKFDRPAFNEERDPGPPTADLFEPAPVHPHTLDFVPTPEAKGTAPPIIGSVVVAGEYDYNVISVDYEGDLVHLRLSPVRDPDRNRLREIWAERKTYELRKLIATDKLFIEGSKGRRVYGVLFTVTMKMLDGMPVVSDIHGVVGDGYHDDGQIVDYHFTDITFPKTLPDWYFDVRQYKARANQAPN